MKTFEAFKNFLIKNDALDKFIKGASRENYSGFQVNKDYPYRLIDLAFMWDATEEGFKFWGMLDNMWRTECNLKNLEDKCSVISVLEYLQLGNDLWED